MGDGGGAPPQMEGNALLKAVFQGKLRLSRLLLEGGAYINEGDQLGRTPLAAACLADYEDPGTRVRMLRYLLERGADANIPDKGGRTALMHACARRAGEEAVAVLLAGGADPSLKDHSGRSALTRALDGGQRDTLRVLLEACRAKGKEVIIITSDTSPSGTKKTRQYLNSPPSPGGADAEPRACMSPSDVEIATSSPSGEGVFSFSAPPRSDARPQGERRAAAPPRKLLKRLNSEPWGLAAPSACGALPTESVARLSQRMDAAFIGEPARPPTARRHSIETHEPKAAERFGAEFRAPSGRADEVQRRPVPYLWSVERGEISAGPEPSGSERRRVPGSVPGSPEKRRRYDGNDPSGRRPGIPERRGSGTFPLERLSHGRLPCGFLPPLNVKLHRGAADVGEPPSPTRGAHKIRVPVAPASPKRGSDLKCKKKLMRRHSMQTEQMKQLSAFQEKAVESYGD
ncbi:ankyrin repeat domain-containing protein 34A-like [Corythoichthys intestinalis]|uniref:ankyrin repeat domain-containing protein 34A-like n=1 Tax=Corythoichthys intestinalis TaxID=161448 RepID=UPI0025A53FB2|nr:ankyrin repeat domain-containing protein 34A-like [Corythoichthys intestinalis]XP_061789048.1 ankyrin repeat domain-containing protein 34A-like [Nerophis lumbriciformis]